MMVNWWNKFYKNNKAIVWAAIVAIALSIGVLIAVKDEVTRFTLIMPIFAGFILFSILITADEELENGETKKVKKKESSKKEEKTSKKSKKKTS